MSLEQETLDNPEKLNFPDYWGFSGVVWWKWIPDSDSTGQRTRESHLINPENTRYPENLQKIIPNVMQLATYRNLKTFFRIIDNIDYSGLSMVSGSDRKK